MEEMDIDSVMEIPDTPDRLFSRRIKGGDCVDAERSLSVAGPAGGFNSVGDGSIDRPRSRGMLVAENAHHRKHYIYPQKLSGGVDEIEHKKNAVLLSPLEKAQENAPSFRKAAMERSRNSVVDQYMDKGRTPFSKFSSRSPGFGEDCAIFDLTEQKMHHQTPEMALPQVGSENHFAEGRKDGWIPRYGGSYLCDPSDHSTMSRNNHKGKEKIDDTGVKGVASVIDHGKGVDLSHGSPLRLEKQLHASQSSIVSPRAVGRKRLVRNGCISPQNIAIRAKQLNEKSENSSKVEQNAGNVVSSPCMVDIGEMISEDNNYSKGKGVLHPLTSKEHDINFINISDSPMCNIGEASCTSNLNRDICFEDKGGWRSTRNRTNIVDYAAGHYFSSFNDVGCQVSQQNERVVNRDDASGGNNMILCDTPEAETGPAIFSNFDQRSESLHAKKVLSKRQIKHVLNSRNSGESSTVIRNDSDIVYLGSSRESFGSRPSRIYIGHHQDVFDIDESSEMRGSDTSYNESVNDEESEARARQVEADEMLARELQEQLYNEAPIFGNGEIDGNIATALRQEEDAFPLTFYRSLYEPHQRSSTRQSRIQPPLRTSQTSSNRRGAQAHFPASARVSRLRSRVMNQSRAAPSRTRNFQFPLDMDLDMRLDILEAMEAVFGDAEDMGIAFPFQVQRDFNENDYEMLLALDENNHQHTGASIHQINSLPLSKVQTDNYEEACVICLEQPAIGETIRHLPCLHKFHKDCIDPWLSRKTSCPVCKSSIT